MGRRGKPRGGKEGGRGGKEGGGRARPVNDNRFSDVPSTNEKFETYYQLQEILPEDEWKTFMDKLHEPLPTTFRITGCREIAPALNEMIKDVLVPFLSGIEHEGVPLSPPLPLSWYPNSYAWQLNVAKTHIRKNEAFKKFQHFLVSETESGNISRQEAVSMLPPLLLDVQPHHYVLDMCAAPGSKSAQLLEAIHSVSATSSSAALPTGLLIANDSDAKRCHLLVHQSLHRIPAAEMMVTNHDATQLPGLRLPVEELEGTAGRKWKALLFDRILADVPCSGDGTLRKNVGIWRDWNVGNGIGLHSLQLRILSRGIALLKPGGRLVYSTCSMNPMENESVVSAALEAHPDMHLVDVSASLPNLMRRPGLTTWKVFDSNFEPAPYPTSAPDKHIPHQKGQKKPWSKTLWPNGKEKERGLEKCWRLYPHVEDTGGFFVAVLEKKLETEGEEEPAEVEEEKKGDEEKVEGAAALETAKRTASERGSSPLPEEPESKRIKADEVDVAIEAEEVEATPTPAAEDSDAKVDFSSLPAEIVGGAPVGAKQAVFKEEPYIYLSPDDEQVKLCIDFFDLLPTFPTSSLLVRNASGHPLRSIYFTSPLVQKLLLANTYTRMRLISCGTKLFTRQGQDGGKDAASYRCKWRLMNEGLTVLRPFMGPKRIVTANLETFKLLMSALNVPLGDIKEEQFRKRIEEMELGSCVLEVAAVGSDITTEQNLVLPFWRSHVSVNLMVEKAEKSALSNRLWGKDITPHAPGPSKRDLRRAQEAEDAKAKDAGGLDGDREVEIEAFGVPAVEQDAALATMPEDG